MHDSELCSHYYDSNQEHQIRITGTNTKWAIEVIDRSAITHTTFRENERLAIANFEEAYGIAVERFGKLVPIGDERKEEKTFLDGDQAHKIIIISRPMSWTVLYWRPDSDIYCIWDKVCDDTIEANFEEAYKLVENKFGKLEEIEEG